MYRPRTQQLASMKGDLWIPNGLILHWPLNHGPHAPGVAGETCSGIARTDVGSAEDFGVMANSPGAAWSYDPRVGGYCLDYSSRMNIAMLETGHAGGTMAGFNPPNDFSASIWAKVHGLVVDGTKPNVFFTKTVDTGLDLVEASTLGMDHNNKLFFRTTYTSGGAQHYDTVTASAAVVFEQWVHMVGTYHLATNGMKLYLNGTLDATVTPTIQADQYIGEWSVGVNNSSLSIHPNAQLWQAMIFNRVLTPSEIRKMYLSRSYS